MEVNAWSFLEWNVLRMRSAAPAAAEPRIATVVLAKWLIKAKVPTLENVVKRKSGRTNPASTILPRRLHLDTCSLCFSIRFSTPTFPMIASELSPDRNVANVALEEVNDVIATIRSWRQASNLVSISVTRRMRWLVSGPWQKSPKILTPMVKLAERQARTFIEIPWM